MKDKNHAASIRARLLNRAKADQVDFQRMLVRYAIERLLYRLSICHHGGGFVLKGATLFTVWMGGPHRVTKDLDLLGTGSPDVDRLIRVFRDVAAVEFAEDGIQFQVDDITGSPIRKDATYAGVRLLIPCTLASARLKVQVDIGLGDAIIPEPRPIEMASLLDLPRPHLRAYAPETVVAEKLEALVLLGLGTSRMKDLYDLDLLGQTFDFDETLIDAVRATFVRRGTQIPDTLPIGLSEKFAGDSTKQTQWRAFLRKATDGEQQALNDVVGRLRRWLWPVLRAAKSSG